MSALIAPGDWTGSPHTRPGLFMRRDALAALAAQDQPETQVYPDRVLVHRQLGLEDPRTLASWCTPARGALGITKATPLGRVHPSWRMRATHGIGIRGADGRITESVVLKGQHDRGRLGVLFSWTRPVPDPRVMVALGRALLGATVSYRGTWPMVAAVLRLLPTPKWSTWMTSWWRLNDQGRPTDIPRPETAKAVRDMIRIGAWV